MSRKNTDKIDEELANVILNTIELSNYEIYKSTQFDEIPGWDSLNHVKIILAINTKFSIKIKNIEVLECRNIGDLQRLIYKKLDSNKNYWPAK